MQMLKIQSLLLVVLLAAGLSQPAAAQRFGDDERFDDEFYGELATRSDDRIYSSSTAAPSSRDSRGGSGPSAPSQSFEQTASVPQTYKPWSGTWWPRPVAELAFKKFNEGLSPLEKYDSIVLSLYGKLAGAAAWEADPVHRHNYAPAETKLDWSGHCNGLAAASILAPEPTKSFQVPLGRNPRKVRLKLKNPKSAKAYLYSDRDSDYEAVKNDRKNITLTVADMKGLLSETYMTCKTQKFENRDITGRRYNREEIDPNDEAFRDIHPHYFHWILQEFVKKNGMVIVAEIDPHFPVNNHPLFKYETKVTHDSRNRRYRVSTKCYFSDYASTHQFVGTNVMTRTYTYDLHQDSSGRVTRGSWTGRSAYNHPDFVWIPTSDAPHYKTYENAAVNGDFVRWLFMEYGRN